MYWANRKHYKYYTVIQNLLESIGKQESILDIGSCDTPVSTWGDFNYRYTLDIDKYKPLPGVTSIIGSWPQDKSLLNLPVSIITCLQVLEHVENPILFCKEIFDSAKVAVIISVPYKWPNGAEISHIQDPVDEDKLFSWTNRNPTEIRIIDDKPARLVSYFSI